MRYFLLLLKRSRILILFLILEVFAFSWIVSSRSYPRAQFRSSTAEINGQLNNWAQDIKSYGNLSLENQHLAEENARLRALIDASILAQNYGADTVNDSVLQQHYRFIPAKVVNSSYLKTSNYLLLDKGLRSGIKREMGVIGPKGIVGIITEVSDNFARVLPLIHPDISISAALKRDDFFGPLRWNGENYLRAQLNDIPRYAEVSPGDSVITDGRSNIFPPQIMVGTVVERNLQADQNFYQLEIELSTDFAQIDHVYIVKNLLIEEIDSLMNKNP